MKKVLILLRHAHRDRDIEVSDNGLSEKGRKQALKIKRHFKHTFGDEKPLVLSSPKKRCIETVRPLAQRQNTKIEILDFLDEGGDLDEKVAEFSKWWKTEAPNLTVACSHGDVLPVCVWKLTGANVEFRKGAWAEIIDADPKPILVNLIQRLED